jgi:hypothetical protein
VLSAQAQFVQRNTHTIRQKIQLVFDQKTQNGRKWQVQSFTM